MALQRSLWVVAFAIAMAWLESAVVVYLRLLVNRLEPYQADPLPEAPMALVGAAELVREAATLFMLWAVGWLAGDTRRNRFGYFIIAFGVWDLFYYLFLKVICGWPKTVWDWDLLFLIPLPWWGPVMAPALISFILIATGFLLSLNDSPAAPLWPRPASMIAGGVGAAMALLVFMADAIAVAGSGAEAVRRVLPVQFLWEWFLPALALMAAPMADLMVQLRSRSSNGCRTNQLEHGIGKAG